MATMQPPLQVDALKHNRRPSGQTESTAACTSNEAPAVRKMKSKSVDKRRRKRSSKSSGRDMLMGLIAQEMVSTWQSDDDEDLLPEDDAPPILSAADVFYAQMNGESIETFSSVQSGDSAFDIDDDDNLAEKIEDDADAFPDACSFVGLSMPDDGIDETRSRRSEPSMDSNSKHSRSSHSKTSKNSHSRTSKSMHSGSTDSSDETLSVQEIQKFVMENMPEKVRNKIPKEAWAQIFNKAAPDIIRRPPTVEIVSEDEDIVCDNDDASILSDITEFTSFDKEAKRGRKTKVAPMAPDEDRWDEELCPAIDKESYTIRSGDSGSSALSFRTDLSGSVIRTKALGVKFSYVDVRYYERVLDINPSVSSGAAIGVGWRFKRGGKLSVDEWELQQGEIRRGKDLVMPRHVRESMLEEIGYTQKDIADATRIILKAKSRRKTTLDNLGAQGMEEAVEAVSRRVKGLLGFGRRKGLVKP